MKKTFLTFLFIIGIATQMMAMSRSNIRNHARFISDRMAYELDLDPMQYDDCYEINYDFIYHASRIMDDVVYGFNDAVREYYMLLDNRNEDMRYVLTNRQYARYMSMDYFYRPIYSTGRDWAFRIYTIYSNRSFFYYDAPRGFRSYVGGHNNVGFYNNRYNHERYNGGGRIVGSDRFEGHSRNDFGTIRRDRNGRGHEVFNDYRNPYQNNRTEDRRYRDRSGNQYSPQINNRSQNNNNNNNVNNNNNNNNNNNGQYQNNRPQNNGQYQNNGGHSQQNGTRTDNRQGSTRQNNGGMTGGRGHNR